MERAALERSATRILQDLGESIPIRDGDGLLAMRAKAWTELLVYDLLVDDLEPTERYGQMFHVSGEATGEAKPHVRVVMRDAERDRFAKLDEVCVKLGLVERQTRLAETLAQQEGQLIASVFRGVLGDPELGLTAGQRDVARTVVARHLRAVAGPAG